MFKKYLTEAVRKPKQKKILEPVAIAGSKFTVPAALAENFKITSSLRDFDRGSSNKWLAKTIAANNGGKIGKFEQVGYVMINTNNNQIVPISINDEHHQGFDLMVDYRNQGLIENVGEWEAITSSTNYLYYRKDVPKKVIAAKKWIEYGGDPETVMVSTGHGDMPEYKTTFEVFVKTKGNPPTSHSGTGVVNPQGRYIFGIIERIAKMVSDYHTKHRLNPQMFDLAMQLVDWDKSLGLNSPWFTLGYEQGKEKFDTRDRDWLKRMRDEMAKAHAKEDVGALEKFVFSHDGFKNIMHIGLKLFAEKAKDNKLDSFEKRKITDLEFVFGDLDAAVQELNRIGNI